MDDAIFHNAFGDMRIKAHNQWSGFYFGGHIGTATMKTDFGDATGSLVAFILRNSTLENEAQPSGWTALPSTNSNGRSYGGFIGYNYQWDRLVTGFEAAYHHASIESSSSDAIARTVTVSTGTDAVSIAASSAYSVKDYATFRGRAGYTFGQFLPYATIGVAVGRVQYATTASVVVTDVNTLAVFAPPPATDSKNAAITAGLAAGLGVDVTLLPNMFLRAEWEFVGFGHVGGIKANINTARVGLALKF
jgi:opacity protein-like surface antigen